jgi:hypothetical protein
MRITRQIVADQVGDYLRHQLSLDDLVDWAEQQILDGEFESTSVRDAVARLGVADVRAFGLTWDDTQRLLGDLGYAASIQIGTA